MPVLDEVEALTMWTSMGNHFLHRIGKYVRFNLDDVLEWAKAGCPKSWK